MLTVEEEKLPLTYPPQHRKDELIAFCRRYNDTECCLTDAEKALIDGVALDMGEGLHSYIIAFVSSEMKFGKFYNSAGVPAEYKWFNKKICQFFSVLNYRKRKLENRGKYIIDSFEGTVKETSRVMQEHTDNGWSIINASTFFNGTEPRSVVYFQKLEAEEQPLT